MHLTIDIWTVDAVPALTVEADATPELDANRALAELASAAWRAATA